MEKHRIHPASHCPLIVISRADGRASVAAAAYAARTRMTDQRTGKVHNFTRVRGLLHEGLVNWKGTAEELWNAAEMRETRRNARVARELRPALPAELPLDDQRRLVHGFCLHLKDKYGIAAHWIIHARAFHEENGDLKIWSGRKTEDGENNYLEALFDPERTNLNFHAHIRNEQRWEHWLMIRQLSREKAGLEDARHIAESRKAERRAAAELQKKKVAAAQSVEEQRKAVSEANSIDVPSDKGGLDAAIRWAERNEADAGMDQEFKPEIDPEVFISPDTKEAPREDFTVKRKSAKGIGPRVRA